MISSEIATLGVELQFTNVEKLKKQVDSLTKELARQTQKLPPAPDFSFRDIIPDYKELKGAASQYNELGQAFGYNSKVALEAKSRIDLLNKSIGLTSGEMAQLLQKTRQVNFDFLTLLFAGMLMRDTFGGALKSIAAGYDEITKKNSAFGIATTKLSANFNYLKFAIGRALDDPRIINAIEFISDKINDLADYLADNSWASTGIIVGLGFLAAVGASAMFISSVIQFKEMFGILKAMAKLDISKITGKVDDLVAKLGGIQNIKLAFGVAGVALSGLDAYSDFISKESESLFERFVDVAGWTLAGGLIGGLPGAFLGFFLGFTIEAIDLAYEKGVLDEAWESFKNIVFGNAIGVVPNVIIEGINLFKNKDSLLNAQKEIETEIKNLDTFAEPLKIVSQDLGTIEENKISEQQLESMAKFREELMDLDSTRLQELISNYGELKTGMDNVINITPALLDQLELVETQFEEMTSKSDALGASITNLTNKLNNLNGKTFTYTVREKREVVTKNYSTTKSG